MDHCFGRFLEAFEAAGLSKNTAVIVAGDHGTNVGERGKFGKGAPVREREIHIPLFIKTPDGETGRSSAIFQPQDFFATIANLAGAPIPDDIESYDILNAARKNSMGNRELALAGVARGKAMKHLQRGYFTVFDREGYLEWHPNPEDSILTPYGSLDDIASENPDRVQALHASGLAELERRNADPIFIDWLKNGAVGKVPECALYDGYPGPEGFEMYSARIYRDAQLR